MKKATTNLESSDRESLIEFPPEYLRLERSLILLGFFTPKKKTNKLAREKVIRYTKPHPKGGKPLEVEIRIIAGGNYGLPTVADQDKYLALQSIIQKKLRLGESIDPITFHSVDIVRELGISKGGWSNEDVGEWMHRMFVTSVFRTVREADGKKRGAEEDIRPFRRRVAYNDFLESGERATTNYIWLDEGLLKSYLENRLINFDLQRYLRLKGSISKALAIHLHVWMFAARESGTFEKLYGHLCQLLGIENYAGRGLGRVMQQLGPHFDELRRLDFLSGATVERARTARDFKIVLKAGKYLAGANPAPPPLLGSGEPDEERPPVGDEAVLALLPEVMRRGIPEPRARRLLTMYLTANELRKQLALVDSMYRNQKSEIRNAVGYYIRALEEKWQAAPPAIELRGAESAPGVDVNLCPDCGGAGYYYPEGYERGVKICNHPKMKQAAE